MKKRIVCTLFRGQTRQSYDLPFEGASCPRQCVAREKAFFAIYSASFQLSETSQCLFSRDGSKNPGRPGRGWHKGPLRSSTSPRELHPCNHLTNSPHSLLHKQTCDLGLFHCQVNPSCLEKARWATPALRGCYWQPALPYVCAARCLSGRSSSC